MPSSTRRAVAAGGAIEEGWLVAPLDPWLDTERPYGVDVRSGVVAGLLVAPEAEAPAVLVESTVAIAGRGLEGERYAAGRGTFSVPGRGYELTLVEAETLAELDIPCTRAVGTSSLAARRSTRSSAADFASAAWSA